MSGTVDVVEVHRFRLDLSPPEVESLAGLLDVRERARLEMLRSAEHRRRFTVAHARTRLVLADRLGVPSSRVRFRFGPYGKPGLDGDAQTRRCQFSLTHSGDLAVLALCHDRRVGVDVEHVDRSRDPDRFAARWFPAHESAWVSGAAAPDRLRAFLRLWTRKEACVKATGGRLVQGLALPVGTAPCPRTVDGPPGFLGPWTVTDLPEGRAHVGAVALEGTRPFRVMERSAG
ncbi:MULTISPECIES: 4'-phosphopantetheinyl transferase family protein [unclassified Streptomyces]|uniref:4'-phosphopantetheinyl transferase family protein n=1 Tax=unclassified Streptomyces TaxID=2593676 RepID=UPI000DAE9735|nr:MULTISPECIES: 4'-phosphopantetheinyl transferase superfamily protein [unclassified Streptomyces]PZT77848.1 hypothetical protein DNK56_32470 [Streptomyces sp. AC1-42W]PZT78201.1 hypothetical protein DNK55_00220 [Streptomyces sp. AC1-42T]